MVFSLSDSIKISFKSVLSQLITLCVFFYFKIFRMWWASKGRCHKNIFSKTQSSKFNTYKDIQKNSNWKWQLKNLLFNISLWQPIANYVEFILKRKKMCCLRSNFLNAHYFFLSIYLSNIFTQCTEEILCWLIFSCFWKASKLKVKEIVVQICTSCPWTCEQTPTRQLK